MDELHVICPKHRIVMPNGVCKMCQSEFYDKYYRKYSKNSFNDVPKNETISDNDIERLKNKFNAR